MEEQRYYYKFSDNHLVCTKSPLEEEDCEEITQQEYEAIREAKRKAREQKVQEWKMPTGENKKMRIAQLKKLLQDSDYQAIKYAEGWISEEDYAPIKALRQSYRDEINQLEQQLEDEQ